MFPHINQHDNEYERDQIFLKEYYSLGYLRVSEKQRIIENKINWHIRHKEWKRMD